jgi:exosortase K
MKEMPGRIPVATWILWGLTLVLIALLKLRFSTADADELAWMLVPVVRIVELFSGEPFAYVPGSGYFNQSDNTIINAGCAGINYLIIVIALTVFSVGLPRLSIRLQWMLWPGLLAGCYLFTVLVNAARIIGAVSVSRIAGHGPFLHMAFNICFYLTFLILHYGAVIKIKEKLCTNLTVR